MKTTGLIRVFLLMVLGISSAQAGGAQTSSGGDAAPAMRAAALKAPSRPELIHLAPVGGLTFARLKGNTTTGYDFSPATGYEGGISVLVGRGRFQFETGLMYAERSMKESYKMGVSQWDLNYTNKYIELPVLVRYNFINNSDIRVYAKGGAIAALLQDSRGTMSNMQNYNSAMVPSGIYSGIYNPYSYGVTSYNSNLIQNNDTKSAFATADFRWAAGIGGQVRMTKTLALLLEADYQTSINSASNTQPDGYYGSTNMNLVMETYGIKTGVLISL